MASKRTIPPKVNTKGVYGNAGGFMVAHDKLERLFDGWRGCTAPKVEFAGTPPLGLIMFMYAIARPAPLTDKLAV